MINLLWSVVLPLESCWLKSMQEMISSQYIRCKLSDDVIAIILNIDKSSKYPAIVVVPISKAIPYMLFLVSPGLIAIISFLNRTKVI